MAIVPSAGLGSDEELALDCRGSGGGGGGGGGVTFVPSAELRSDEELALDCRGGGGGGGGGGGVTLVSSAGLECDGELLSLECRLGRGGGGGGGGDVFSGFLDGLVMVCAACTLFFSFCFNSSLGSSIGMDQLLCIIPLAILGCLGFIGVLVSSGEGIGSLGNNLVTGFACSLFASTLSMTLSVVVASSVLTGLGRSGCIPSSNGGSEC